MLTDSNHIDMNTDIIFTDGACSGNGKDTSTGGFGIYMKKTIFSESEIKLNKKCETKTITIKNKEFKFPVTNIRMEGFAILTTLWLYAERLVNGNTINKTNMIEFMNKTPLKGVNNIKENYSKDELKMEGGISNPDNTVICIITDSKFWMNVIEKWLPGWSRKNIIMQKKNPDIVLKLLYYTTLLRHNGIEVKYVHVHSHQKGKRTEHADGNDEADVLATSSSENSNTSFVMK